MDILNKLGLILNTRLKLLVLFLFYGLQSVAAGSFYLSSNEKIALLIGLKMIELSSEQRNEIGKKVLPEINKKLSMKAKKIKINNFNEFIEGFTRQNYYNQNVYKALTIEELVKNIEPVAFQANSPKVQRSIDLYLQNRISSLKTAVEDNFNLFDVSELSRWVERNITNPTDLETKVDTQVLKKIDFAFDGINTAKTLNTEVLSRLLKSYFINLPQTQKKQIYYNIIQLPLDLTTTELFATFVQSSGPQLQKLLQIVGRDPDLPEQFQKIFEKLESDVKPIPWKFVEKVLIDEGVQLSEFLYFEKKPLGIGTMAQTHRVQYIENGVKKSAVIRFLKPEIESLLEMDYQILKKVTAEIDVDLSLKKYSLPPLSKLIDDINQSTVEELNVEKTILSQIKAKEIYNNEALLSYTKQKNYARLNVPTVRPIGHSQKVMLQELVFGKKPVKLIIEYKDIYPELYKELSQFIADRWIKQAFFQTGFFHADLHQGNLLVQMADEAILVNILDYGMVGNLDLSLRESALLLSIGIKTGNPELIIKRFRSLSKNKILPNDFSQKVRDRILLNTVENNDSVLSWVTWALKNGLELNYEFLKLNRGLKAIQMLLTDSKSSFSVDHLVFNIFKNQKTYAARLLLSEKALKPIDYIKLAKFGLKLILEMKDMEKVNRNVYPTKNPQSLMCESLFR